MRNEKIINSWDKIKPDDATHERILGNILDRVHSGETQKRKEVYPMNKTIKWLAPVAACLVIAVAIYSIPNLFTRTPPVETVESNPENNPENNPASNGELAIVPPWNERPVTQQFGTITFNGFEYQTNPATASIYPSETDELIGTTTSSGHDGQEDKTYTINCEVYSIKSISDKCAVAVKYEEHDGYYPFRNPYYVPATLGDLINDLNLRDNLVFGMVYEEPAADNNFSMTAYTLPDTSAIWDLLLADTSLKNEGDMRDGVPIFMGVPLMGVSIDVNVIGHKNIGISVNADGYMQTNILDTGKTFFIGKDKVQAFIDYVKKNGTETEIEIVTGPSVLE